MGEIWQKLFLFVYLYTFSLETPLEVRPQIDFDTWCLKGCGITLLPPQNAKSYLSFFSRKSPKGKILNRKQPSHWLTLHTEWSSRFRSMGTGDLQDTPTVDNITAKYHQTMLPIIVHYAAVVYRQNASTLYPKQSCNNVKTACLRWYTDERMLVFWRAAATASKHNRYKDTHHRTAPFIGVGLISDRQEYYWCSRRYQAAKAGARTMGQTAVTHCTCASS